MVMAAGRGERLRPLTDRLPKPLVPVAGKPLIVYHLEALAKAGIRDVVINLSWLGDRIQEALGEGHGYGVHIHYSEEGPVPLETGGGIFKALPLLGPEPFLVVNGDVWTDIDFGALALEDRERALGRHNGADARIVLVPNPAHNVRGDFALDGDAVLERDVTRPSYTYSGVGIYRPELFAGCSPGKFPLLPLLQRSIAARRLRGQVHQGDWCDVGSIERLRELDGRIRSRISV
jgi:N-acetyl-alpha-D-muramate 1-phosphate uridylyltransferase